MNIGERLREARESKNISLEQLQDETKIQKRYLVAIEEGDFDLLPGTFYARAFIKEYALAIGLNPNTLLAEHADELPTSDEELEKQYSRMERTRRRNRSSASSDSSAIFSLIPRIIVILLIIGIIFIAWTLIQKTLGDDSGSVQDENDRGEIIREPREDEPSTIDDEEPEKEADLDESTDEDEADHVSFEVSPGTGTTPESSVVVNYTGDELVLRFEASGGSWLAVDTNTGESLYSQEISPDESPVEFEITDHEEVYLNVGNAPALDIFFNNEKLDYPVDADDRVHQKLILQINKQ